MNVRATRDLRSSFQASLAALLQPCFDLFQIPHDASWRKIEASWEFATLFHLVNGAVGQWHDEPKFMSPDRSRKAGQNGRWAGISDRIPVVVDLVWHHQNAHAAWFL
jgi:hypothetical protein